ncbi:MAG: hypothetical protein KKH98_06115 [Spirochaetes bacterium]|nr:hypothetical protein [Spirochaetota bacterium]
MEWIPIFLGVLFALAFYLHFISKMNDREEKLKKAEYKLEAEKQEIPSRSEVDEKSFKPRNCPLCGSPLKKHESLYAEMYEGENRPKVIIHGCRYCYMPSSKKTDFKADESDSLMGS